MSAPRGVIISTGGRLNIELPLGAKAARSPEPASADYALRTDAQIRQIEADNIRAVLKAANGKVSGPSGAAQLLGLKSTTLTAGVGLIIAPIREAYFPRHPDEQPTDTLRRLDEAL